MEKRLFGIIGACCFLAMGLGIGLTIQHLWLDPAHIASTAQAATRENAQGKTEKLEPIDKKTRITEVVERVSPAVVTVGAFKNTVVRQPWFDDFFFGTRYILREQTTRIPYLGSGFLIDQEGLILTNYHVIQDSKGVFVTLPDGREFNAELVDADKYIDVALLRIDPGDEELPEPLSLEDSNTLSIGEQVLALGNPFGNLIDQPVPTLTVGYISALHRTFRPDVQNERVYQDMIQTDAAVNPGNSGGPLVDINGKVVGMNTFIFSTSGSNIGISFAIPSQRLLSFVDEVKQYGRQRDLMVDFDFRTVRTRQGTAVQILTVDPSGPAASAGLQPGDLLLGVDGREVKSREDFFLILASKQVGNELQLEILRHGENEPITISYTIAEAM